MNETVYHQFPAPDKESEKLVSKVLKSSFFSNIAGPFLLMLLASVMLLMHSFSFSFIFFIASLGYLFVWNYQIKGAIYSIGLFLFSLGFLYFIQELNLSIFIVSLILLTVISSYLVLALTAEHLIEKNDDEKRINEEKFINLEQTYQTNQKYLEEQIDKASSDYLLLQKQEKHLEKEIHGYKHLLMASKVEAEGYFQQVKELEKTIELYHYKLIDLEYADENYQNLKERASKLQKLLNQSRVKLFQQEIFLEENTLKNIETIQISELDHKELTYLQNKYLDVQRKYEHCLLEYDHLCQETTSRNDTIESRDEMITILEEKGGLLSEYRMNLAKIEESIERITRVSDTADSLSASNREVARLEKENQLLHKALLNLVSGALS